MKTVISQGYFGRFGGQYVSELLLPALQATEAAFETYRNDPAFLNELQRLRTTYCGRPTPLYRADRFSGAVGCTVYLKREDLLHGGAHKINNTVAQVLLAHRIGKKKLIAETGAGQHGVAVAMAGALFGLEARIFMGAVDVERQALNVQRMRLCGATVVPVTSGSRTLKDAINEALRTWMSCSEDTFYVFGSVAGPHPFPTMVAEFQRVIGDEAREQILAAERRLPHSVIACVGGGSNAMGIFKAFVEDADVKLFGVEAAGKGLESGAHSAPLNRGKVGVFHGSESYVLQTHEGQIQEAHSIAPGLDYPGVGPEHSYLKDTGRAEYVTVTDEEALAAFRTLAHTEGILPALESSHALAYAQKLGPTLSPEDLLIVNVSGRGDKDLNTLSSYLSMSSLRKQGSRHLFSTD